MISFNSTGSFLPGFPGPDSPGVDSGQIPLQGDLPDNPFDRLMRGLSDMIRRADEDSDPEHLLQETPTDGVANTLSGQLLALVDILKKGSSEELTPQQQAWLRALAQASSAGQNPALAGLVRQTDAATGAELQVIAHTQGQLLAVKVGTPAETATSADDAARTLSLQLPAGFRDSLAMHRSSATPAVDLPALELARSAQGDSQTQSLSPSAGMWGRADAPGMAAERAAVTEWAPIRADTSHSQWARELVASLGDRLSMQIRQQVKEASVRLDPPELGKLELIVRMDGDRLNIQLNASHAGVRDMLTQHAERLRNDLLAQNLQVIDVQVGQDSHGHTQQQAQLGMPEVVAAHPEREESDDQAVSEGAAENRWLSTSA